MGWSLSASFRKQVFSPPPAERGFYSNSSKFFMLETSDKILTRYSMQNFFSSTDKYLLASISRLHTLTETKTTTTFKNFFISKQRQLLTEIWVKIWPCLIHNLKTSLNNYCGQFFRYGLEGGRSGQVWILSSVPAHNRFLVTHSVQLWQREGNGTDIDSARWKLGLARLIHHHLLVCNLEVLVSPIALRLDQGTWKRAGSLLDFF